MIVNDNDICHRFVDDTYFVPWNNTINSIVILKNRRPIVLDLIKSQVY